MSALYRRKRPYRFEAVVGQEHVKEVLQNAIRRGRLAHAYLFSGPRGVGKTTVARLLAMAVGCEAPGDQRPCGTCRHCRMVREGSHPDVLEIDAASNNSVEDVRELKERILLAPLVAPKKVIILDEAHMMSKSAFNALLKTLEEPPEHVIFVFATTEPERVPATIRSRTQHFRFRRLSEEEILEKLREICREEGLEAEDEALRLIARSAEGAMRDAESLLERALALGRERFTKRDAEELLGVPPGEEIAALADELLAGGPEAFLGRGERLFLAGYSPKTLLQELARELRGRLVRDPGSPALSALLALDEGLSQLGREEDLLHLELALLRVHRAAGGRAEPGAPAPREQEAPAAEGKRPPAAPERPAPPPADGEGWDRFLKALPPTLRAVVREARHRLEGGRLVLVFPRGYRFHYQRAQASRERLLRAAGEVLGATEVTAVLDEEDPGPAPSAEEPPPPAEPEPAPPRDQPSTDSLDDPRVRYLVEVFNAELLERGKNP